MTNANKETIYIVAHGAYSDYRVVAVFDTKEMAEEYRAWHKLDWLEEFPLNPTLPQMRSGYNLYRVTMWRNGDTRAGNGDTHAGAEPVHEPAGSEDKTNLTFQCVSGTCDGTETKTWYLLGDVLARDEQHAVKIANEKRTQLIAEGKWPLSTSSVWQKRGH